MAFDVVLRDPGTGFDLALSDSGTNAQAGCATATATAQNPNPDVQASAEYVYLDTLIGVRPSPHVASSAAEATAQAAAHDLAVLSSPGVEPATALADAQGANGSQEVNAVEATASAVGLDATVDAITGGTDALAECALVAADAGDVGGGLRLVQAELVRVLARRAA